MIISARSRDPRLMRMRPQPSNTVATHLNVQQPQQPLTLQMSMSGGQLARALPRIPKFSQSNNGKSRNIEDRDPRSRRNKEKVESKSSKSSPSSKDKSKSSPSSKSSSTSTRSRDRKKSGSSDDSSPRKKSEDEKKSSRSSSSHHRSSTHSSKSPAKMSTHDSHIKDIDLRVLPGPELLSMKPDSTTSLTSKATQNKLLSDLMNGDELKSSHEMITSDNGKENKPILAVAINAKRFIATMM